MTKRMLGVFAALLMSFNALAEFNYEGKGKLTYPTGMAKPFTFGFAFKKIDYGYQFKIGSHEMEVDQVPGKYTIWVNLHQEQNVFVQEFAKGYFQGFEWKLGEHSISLKKKKFEKDAPRGNYVLNINGVDHFFKGKNGAIEILFNKDGIRSIETEGFVKDLGIKG